MRFAVSKSSRKASCAVAVLTVAATCAFHATAAPGKPYAGTPTDILTYHVDNARTGSNRQESDLTVASVSSAKFGLLQTVTVQGDVLAQPLLVAGFRMPDDTRHDVLVVATESNDVYAIDAGTYATLWHVSLGTPQNLADVKCSKVERFSGVSATPVIARSGPGHATLYVVAATEAANGKFQSTLHALDLADGSDRQPPANIAAQVTLEDGSKVAFDARHQFVRAGLAYHDGGVYFGMTARCEAQYEDKIVGWLMRYDDHLVQTAAFSTIQRGAGLELASVWAGGFAPAIDRDGTLIVATGNGNFSRGGKDWGESVLALAPDLGGVDDYFTPASYRKLNREDGDLGGGGVLLIPTRDGQAAPPLAVAMGKAHTLYLLDRQHLGHVHDGDTGALQVRQLDGEGIWGGPCYWLGPTGGRVYYQSRDDVMRAYAVDTSAQPSLSDTAQGTLAARNSLPVVSSHGSDAGTGVVWTVGRDRLDAYDAQALGAPIFEGAFPPWSAGTAFLTPLVVNGKVYVGTSGGVAVFGLTD